MSKKYLMSSNQKRIFTLEQSRESSLTYNMPLVLTFEKALDYSRLNEAFNHLCERHESLRTNFLLEKDKFIQCIYPLKKQQVEMIDGKTGAEVIKKFVRPFDLEKDSLIRMGLGKDQNGLTLLMIDAHHIISDGASTGILLKEFSALYDGDALEPVELHYKDFSAWQNNLDIEEQEEFWQEEFLEPLPETELPIDFKHQHQAFAGHHVERKINSSIKKRIDELNKETRSTGFTLFLTTLMIFLSKLNRQDRVVVGTVAEGRSHPSAEEMIGMFVNTLPIIETVDHQKNFLEILEAVKNKSLDVFENQDVPYEKIVEYSSKNPIFDVMFSYEVGYDEMIQMGGQYAKIEQIQLAVSKFDLTITLIEHAEDYTINWEYHSGLFKEETIQQLAEHFNVLLENLLTHPAEPVSTLQYLKKEQLLQIKEAFNRSQELISPSDFVSPIDQFENQVLKNPDKTALYYLEEQITYSQLNERANAVANQLKQTGIGKNDVAALIVAHSPELIVGLLGILKTGAAYLPITPTTPIERINYMITNSQAKAVLCSSTIERTVTDKLDCKPTIFDFKNSSKASITRKQAEATDLSYIIYTSGSTGTPKGVMIENHSLVNLIKWQEKEAEINETSIILQKAIYTFDASVWEIFLALLSGSSLQLLSVEEQDDFGLLLNIFEKNHVTHFLLVPTFLEALLDYTKENSRAAAFATIQAVYIGAEKVTNHLLRKFVEITGKDRSIIRNLYGPTEGTVCATYYRYSEQLDNQDTLIGKPIKGSKIYVMNGQTFCGIDLPGELCIGGEGVARGYLNQPELTAKQFITLDGEVIYKTGDLGKYRADGSIDYLGRLDNQVKIRGFRVELAEIKQALLQAENVKSAAVVTKKLNGTTHLCAYVVAEITSENVLKEHLKQKLPDYMVPNYFIFLEQLPITANGKLNEKQLPEPVFMHEKNVLKPETEKEELAVRLFKEVLQLEQVNLLDSFYELGGDSIKAIRIVSKARELDYQLTVKEIMQAKTIREIAQKMKKHTQQLTQEMVTGTVSPTPVQSFFYSSHLNKPEHFNQSMILQTNQVLNTDYLQEALDGLVYHHDLLRMCVDQSEQKILPWEKGKNYTIHFFQLSEEHMDVSEEIQTIGADFQAKFRFNQSPLLRILVFQSKTAAYVWVQMHHLIVDAVSWQIFIEDLNSSYNQLLKGHELQLPSKTISYLSWSEGLKEAVKSYEISKDLTYWQEINQKVTESTVFDQMSASIQTQTHTFTFTVGKAETEQLRFSANKAFSTELSDLLLTAWTTTLGHFFKRSTVSFTLEGHGRELSDSIGSVDRTIGWFTSMYPLVLMIEDTLPESIKLVKETIRKIPNKGITYGLLTNYTDKIVNEKTDVTFNYLGELGAIQEDEQIFSISEIANINDSASENSIGSPLSINCYLQNDQLVTDLVYAEPFLSADEVSVISEMYQKELSTVINYCVTRGETQKTASDLGELSWSQAEFDTAQERAVEIGNGGIQRIIPLTSMQEGLLYHKLLDETSTSYVIQCSYDVNAEINQTILAQSLIQLGEKHPALKTNILYKDIKEPRQVIYSGRLLESNYYDLSKEEDAEAEYLRFKTADVNRGFDLEKEALFRVTLVEMPECQRLIFTFHHIIMDGWCLSIVLNDWMKLYASLENGNQYVRLAPTEADTIYEEYARTVTALDKEASLAYWETLLEEYETQAGFTGMYPKNDHNAEVRAIFETLSSEETSILQKFANQNSVTMNTIIEAMWGLVLQRYNHTGDVVFGKMVSGRNMPLNGIEQAVGLFINAIPVRVKNKETDPFVTIVQELQKQSLESDAHTYCSLSEIQNRSLLGKELIQTIVVFENYAVQEADNFIDFLGEMEDYREQTSYPISLSVGSSEQLSFKLMFDERLFTTIEAEYILSRVVCGLKELAQNNLLTCGDFSLVSKAEQDKVIWGFNPEKYNNQSYPTILAALKAQADMQPDKIAVVFEETQLTYKQLEVQSTCLAQRLLEAGAKDAAYIGLYCDRTPEMVIGIYGIMKTGAAYIPLAPTLPEERIAYILADSGIEIVADASKTGQPSRFPAVHSVTYTVDELENDSMLTVALPKVEPDDKAYVIYTSGTTGQPKGVTVGHASLMNLVNWQKEYFELDSNQTILQQFSLIFDGSVFELFAGCLTGGTLEIISDEVKNDPDRFLQKLDQKILITVPSLFKMLLEFAEENNRQDEISQLSKVGLAGEATTMALVEKFYQVMTDEQTTLYNLYGPTETTVCASAYQVSNQHYKTVPIGKAVANSQLFVFHQEKLCGIGMLGELCVSGDNLALNYLNNEQITSEKFVENPVMPTEKMYRTGDLVRWQENGELQYVGRIDEQVKIRGFRIELGEIENHLGLIPSIWDTCVITRKINNELVICAYIVTNGNITVPEVKEQLKQTLPDYMVPSFITIMEKLPVTKAGKIDKRALPEPKQEQNSTYEAPRNEMEMMICSLFEEILEVDQVGIDDDFFELGGHSLKAVQLANGISKASAVKVPLSEILQEKNVRHLAEKVKKLAVTDSLILESIEIVDDEEL
ncbi:non-ribosomal peptide synthetase [Enterococcus sp. CWB-B31]|uniref:non-ribosomal peptide synthetase n=1 Tax=Enterococcus sp. CWB-B31 TaxID=2885159 RepID=UPI001E3C2E59|nr:non-ribosomal peptide synthetase [Enterococcus sp. CWB-B31]MCB5953934.1 amino acid adenylation domain-containing protein [Enterococcus sp. CWB-B31]